MEQQIIQDLALAWESLDAQLIIKHLSDKFIYDSQWAFESLDMAQYSEYIVKKFSTIKAHNIDIKVSIIDEEAIKLDQSGNISYYRIRIENDKIIKADMCMF